MLPGVHERKWELDSLIFPLALAVEYWKVTNDASPFDELWLASVGKCLQTLEVQQRKNGHGPYFFDRATTNSIDTLSNNGRGPDYSYTGLIASGFRPSDDACELPFNIPGNIFARCTLQKLSEILTEMCHLQFNPRIAALVQKVSTGLEKWALASHPEFGAIYAYEVDGLGNQVLMDDSNAPSLLSLPHLGAISVDDPLYLSSRQFALSEANSSFYRGSFASGMGSPHTGPDQIWPIALVMQASTSRNDDEIISCIRTLIASSVSTGLLHESFDKDNPSKYSRPWFAWCNSSFGGLIAQLLREKPGLIAQI